MENKVLSQNIEQIKQYNSNLANKILMFDIEKSNIQLAQNENGEYNILFNSIPLHSTSGAIEEAKIICSKIDNKENSNSLRLIYGLGLGYLPDEFSNSISGKIIIYEPNLDILKFVFSIAKIDAIFNKNVFICNTLEDLQTKTNEYIDENTQISISFLNSYKNLYFENIKQVLDIVHKIQGEIIANKNTLIKCAPAAILNTFYNLKNIFNNPNISDLKDIYKNKTALILSAGPSLKENIEIIKNNQDKFVIFALNPTIKLLQANNVKPDFIVNIETSPTAPQLSTINPQEHYFILEGFCHPTVSRMKTKKTFNYLSNSNFFNPWIRDCLNLNDNIETFGTVSYTALMSAFIMGFEKIILVGQDLAYKDGHCYSKECHFGDLECIYDENEKKYKIVVKDFEKFTNAFKLSKKTALKAEELAKKRIEFLNNNLVTIKSQEGKDIPSQTGYVLFIKHFEHTAEKLKKQNPNITLINSSTGGAQIEGYENIPLNKVVETLEPIKKLDLEKYNANFDKNYALEKINSLEEQLKNYYLLIEDFILINQKLLKELENKNIFTENALKFLQKHKELLQNIVALSKCENIGYIVNIFLLKFKKYFDFSYLSDIENAKITIKEIIENYTWLLDILKRSTEALSDSKSFVFK